MSLLFWLFSFPDYWLWKCMLYQIFWYLYLAYIFCLFYFDRSLFQIIDYESPCWTRSLVIYISHIIFVISILGASCSGVGRMEPCQQNWRSWTHSFYFFPTFLRMWVDNEIGERDVVRIFFIQNSYCELRLFIVYPFSVCFGVLVF